MARWDGKRRIGGALTLSDRVHADLVLHGHADVAARANVVRLVVRKVICKQNEHVL